MKATARRTARTAFTHQSTCASTSWSSTSRPEHGGDDDGPEPAGAARGQPRVMHRGHDGDVRQAQGLGHRARSRSRSSTHPAERGCPTRFKLALRLPSDCHRGADRAPAGDRRQVPGPPDARGRGHVRGQDRARRDGRVLAARSRNHLRSSRRASSRRRSSRSRMAMVSSAVDSRTSSLRLPAS